MRGVMIRLNDGGGENPIDLAKEKVECEMLVKFLRSAPKLRTGAPNLTWVAEQIGWSRVTVLTKVTQHNLWPWKPKKA